MIFSGCEGRSQASPTEYGDKLTALDIRLLSRRWRSRWKLREQSLVSHMNCVLSGRLYYFVALRSLLVIFLKGIKP
ncbi:hypothetical protein CEXT_635571 [Caerostris extrusa]|uniref:Uncharacterized protein n=1 Tax=Caerostris extrusa TaxID=172846 RepID=A0AAV4VXK7_CAEEX|nr:hypothetical protein CEXT_635571 [Caerostris extrusa]